MSTVQLETTFIQFTGQNHLGLPTRDINNHLIDHNDIHNDIVKVRFTDKLIYNYDRFKCIVSEESSLIYLSQF